MTKLLAVVAALFPLLTDYAHRQSIDDIDLQVRPLVGPVITLGPRLPTAPDVTSIFLLPLNQESTLFLPIVRGSTGLRFCSTIT